MLCTWCYKKIPDGEEVYKAWFHTRGAKTVGKFHKKCVIKQDRRVKRLWWIFYFWFAFNVITGSLISMGILRPLCSYCGK